MTDIQSATQPVILPFINTPPLFDALLLLVLLPLWWALGLEQIIWFAAAPFIALRVVIQRHGRIRLPLPLRLFALFIGLQLVSALFIVEPERYFTFVRTFAAYVSAFSLALVFIHTLETPRQIKLTLAVISGVIALAAGVSLLGIIGIWQPNYTAPVALFIPESLESTEYGQRLVIRTLGNYEWFSVLGVYFRVSGFFLFATMYAAALMLTLPLMFRQFCSVRSGWNRIAWGVIIGVSGISLVYTTGRIAIAGLVIGGVYFLLTATRLKTLSLVGLAIGVIGVSIWGVVWMTQSQELPPFIARPLDEVIFARGGGSAEDRSSVYAETLISVMERPFFGWGTERDLPTLGAYPAGSHSYYLGVFYKYGIVGLVVFLGMWVSVWWGTRPRHLPADAPKEVYDLNRLLWYGRWVLVGFFINAITEVFDLDTVLLVFLWSLVAVFISAHSMLVRVGITHSLKK